MSAETTIDKLLKNFTGPSCNRHTKGDKKVQFICCEFGTPEYLTALCSECQEEMASYETSTTAQIKTQKNFFQILRDLAYKKIEPNNKNKDKKYTDDPLVKNFLEVLNELQYLENVIKQIKDNIKTKLDELCSEEMFEGLHAVKNQERLRQRVEQCLAAKDHTEYETKLQQLKDIIVFQESKDKVVTFKVKGEEDPITAKDQKQQDEVRDANSRYFKKEMLKYTSKIKKSMDEFYKALRQLIFDKPYDYFDTLHYTFTKFMRMNYECSQKILIDNEKPDIYFQASNDESGTSQFIASKDVVRRGVATCTFTLDLYREGHHGCNFLYVGFIKDFPGWENSFPWKDVGCVKEIFNDCNYPNMRVGYFEGDPVPDNEKYKKMSMKNNVNKNRKGERITMICDKEEGSLSVISPDAQMVYVSRFTPKDVKESNWRFVIGFLFSGHKIVIAQEDESESRAQDAE